MEKVSIGIIGGSGLYQMAGLTEVEELAVDTPFGKPSDSLIVGTLEGKRVAFLARHGRGHRILPSELNFRANIYAMKKLGVEKIISASAVGSLREDHRPLEIVLPDQFFDRTRGRISTFFGEGLVVHVSFAHPVCAHLGDKLMVASAQSGVPVKRGGTYLCMEGPAFSTVAESNVYRSWGMDIIGMTNLQEAKLAREAEICYATVALVTDYDCWHPEHDAVTVDQVLAVLNQNSDNAQKLIRAAVGLLDQQRPCKCGSALKSAILTDTARVPAEVKEKLKLLIGKYIS
ncbi:MAG: S-methyl-5'-thioadenosine phosphorylase [Acidobacteria bacterium]|nr:S-methyl-5'-thioadenosine phosphorylase [Acidobacteriota bacterium]MCI0719308.1 S-methyl-5'-thioadenosine phosphorylase [Acidobacteriota bacterium]